MSDIVEAFSSYVPQAVKRQIAADPAPLSAARTESFPGAVLFSDISGFTALSEKLAVQGPSGAEVLTQHLNDYFSQLIEIIHEHGGDVVKFAGDAMLAVWHAGATAEGLAEATKAAAQCGLVLQLRHRTYSVSDEIELANRISVGAGEVSLSYIGGVADRWESLLTGDPLRQVALGSRRVAPGDVILSTQAWALVSSDARGVPTGTMELLSPLSTVRRLSRRCHPCHCLLRTKVRYAALSPSQFWIDWLWGKRRGSPSCVGSRSCLSTCRDSTRHRRSC